MLTKKLLRTLLLESLVNPKEPGPMKVILDVGNRQYYLMRAVELILEAKKQNLGDGDETITKAITLLAAAKCSDGT